MQQSSLLGHYGRATAIILAMLGATIVMLALVPAAANSGMDLGSIAPNLAVHLGVTGGAAVAIWNAFMSPWAMALSLALVPLGFGSWALVIRATFTGLVKTLGKDAARKAALRF
ncbi:hypothetical protein [Neomicrococcus lactis]|uniref:Uncharacterized protein n=1 Tax=Neomicrococcus lactis TaxID=732241 RepID=A0A7W9DBC3_9MICC|nr:hypothetical protein [Neomicrococcus lactis]MBB5598548.1 hypothetical protein [Neomicrococcus lactis]